MANKKSAQKRARQTTRRNTHNTAIQSSCRTAERNVRIAVQTGDKKAAQAAFAQAEKKLSTAANKKYFHQNNASRKISRLAKLVNSMK